MFIRIVATGLLVLSLVIIASLVFSQVSLNCCLQNLNGNLTYPIQVIVNYFLFIDQKPVWWGLIGAVVVNIIVYLCLLRKKHL